MFPLDHLLAVANQPSYASLRVAQLADAKAKAESYAAEQMSKITGDLPLPPGMKLF